MTLLKLDYFYWLAGIYLAATLQLLKQTRDAQRIIANVSLGQVKDSSADYQSYYDPLIRDAQTLYLLARHFPDRIKSLGADALLSLIEPIAKGRYNTLSSAYLILALDAYAQLAQDTTDVSQLAIIEVSSSGQQKPLQLPAGLLPQVSFSADARKLLVSSSSPLRTFYQVTQSGYDLRVSTDVVKQKLEVLREIVGSDGKAIKELKLGDEAEVHIKLRSLGKSGTLYNLALIDLLPGGFEVVAEADNGQAAVLRAQESQPDVILMDLLMPGMDGIEATRQIISRQPQTRILVLTSFAADNKVFPAIKAGALGYLLKDSSPSELIRAILQVHHGEPSLHPTIARKLLQEIARPAELQPTPEALTAREVMVLQLIAQGLSNQEIADRVAISESTVRAHVSRILAKLHLASRTQAALYAVREGLTDAGMRAEA